MVALPDIPQLTQFAKVLTDMVPPSASPVSAQAVLPGNLILDYCTVVSVNATASVVGTGVTALAPGTCSITYQNTTINGVPWALDPPTPGPAYILVQQPIMVVVGNLSVVSPAQVAAGAPPEGTWISVGATGAPAFGAGWSVGFGGALQFRMLGDMVYIRGVAVGSTASVVFTLPAGYRPKSAASVVGVDQSAAAPAFFNVAVGGGVTPNNSPGASHQFDLSGLFFCLN